MPLEVKVKVDIVKWYYENRGSVINPQRAFKRKYDSKTAPARSTITEIVKRFEDTGSVLDRARPGPDFSQRTPQNVEKARKRLTDSPHRSIRRLSRESDLTYGTVCRILHDDL